MLELAGLFELAFDAPEVLLTFLTQPAELEAAVDECQQHATVERLLDEVKGPFVDRLDQVVVGLLGVAGHQDDIDVAQSGLQPAGDLEAGHFGHADVDDRQVRPQALGLFEGRRPGGDAGDVMPAAEDARQGVQDAGIVVDDQDAGAVRIRCSCCVLRSQGKRGPNARSRPGRALDAKLSAHLRHDRSADGQPEPVAAGLGREERFLDLGQVLLRDAAAGVFDDQLDRGAVGRAGPDRELVAGGGGVAGIADEIEQELLDVGLNGEERGKVGRDLDEQVEPRAARGPRAGSPARCRRRGRARPRWGCGRCPGRY